MELERHPSRRQLERFVRGETDATENRGIVRHLLARCPQCQKAAQACWTQSAPEPGQLVLVAMPAELLRSGSRP